MRKRAPQGDGTAHVQMLSNPRVPKIMLEGGLCSTSERPISASGTPDHVRVDLRPLLGRSLVAEAAFAPGRRHLLEDTLPPPPHQHKEPRAASKCRCCCSHLRRLAAAPEATKMVSRAHHRWAGIVSEEHTAAPLQAASTACCAAGSDLIHQCCRISVEPLPRQRLCGCSCHNRRCLR